ncbi:hypothetical protein NBRC116188_21200 [Oceaniserpentilla sp. 4NH20-0058]|uniref:hypothetical protein n=1 Tax=Oceaniserpentilla sp. 4NH20-0058 TaxID=3127660 RepID=UPI00310A717D
MVAAIKMSLIVGTLLGMAHQWQGILSNASVDWIAWAVSYLLCFLAFFYWDKFSKASLQTDHEDDSPFGIITPAQLDALYKQSIIVERNAHKANKVFSQQLGYVHKLLEKTKNLSPGDDFESLHTNLVYELSVLEQHIERLLLEMNKNVKLGEKLQQSVANLDPEIGVLD